MKTLCQWAGGGFVAVGSLIATECVADSTDQQLTDQATGQFEENGAGSDVLKQQLGGGRADNILSEYAYLDEYFQLMDGFGTEGRLQAALKELQSRKETVRDVIRLYKLLGEAEKEGAGDYGEARWRALYLLSQLRDPAAADFLSDVATRPLPSASRVGEMRYRQEYRLRARAIAGLEAMRQTEQLQRIYNEGGMLSGLAAASLFELGQPPEGVEKLDGREVLGMGDPTDVNPRRGEIADKLPSVKPDQPRPPSQNDDVPAIIPRLPIRQ